MINYISNHHLNSFIRRVTTYRKKFEMYHYYLSVISFDDIFFKKIQKIKYTVFKKIRFKNKNKEKYEMFTSWYHYDIDENFKKYKKRENDR